MSNMFCITSNCMFGEENWAIPDDSGEQYALWPTNPRDWYDIKTELPYMAEICCNDCTESFCCELIDYIRRHLEHTEEIELWRLWMGEENYKIKWYTLPIDELTPQDLMTLYNMPDLFGKDIQNRYGITPSNNWAVQHCLTITREPCEWDSARMKNWRDLYPLL